MKYSALLMIISGVAIACVAGVRYASGEPSDWGENPFVLAIPLVFAVALVTTGTGLWAVGGRRHTVSEPAAGPHPATSAYHRPRPTASRRRGSGSS
jgi:hypothetical protein